MSDPHNDHEGPVSAIAPTIAIDTDRAYGSHALRRTQTKIVDMEAEDGAPASSTGRLPDVGDTVGHYVLVQKLGEGAHGAVYRAHRVGLEEHRVALKIIPCTRERLPLVRQELVTLATVVHPNIVQLSDHDVEGTFAWFTMPFYEGTPLDVRLGELFAKGETLSLEDAYEIFHPLAGALAALHAAGFRHQDIKPENIFLARFADKEHPILLDLGVAIGKDHQKFLAGTREYFAPEQLAAFLHALKIRIEDAAPVVSEKMDVYGLAATLLLAIVGPKLAPGARLLRGESADLDLDDVWKEIDGAQRARETDPIVQKALRTLRGPPRRDLEAAFRKWFRRDPEKRPAAAQMAHELPVLLGQRKYLEARRRKLTRIAIGAATFLLVGAPIAYGGGRYAVSLKECQERVAADVVKSGQIADTLKGCQVQADGLMQKVGECSAGLTRERGEREAVERDIGTKLSSCTNADAQLRSLVAGCQVERDGAQTKAKDCAAALTKSDDADKVCNTALEGAQGEVAKCGADLAKSGGELTKCSGDLAKAGLDVAKCDADLGSCKADIVHKEGEVAKKDGDLAKLSVEKAECANHLSSCATDLGGCKSSVASFPQQLATCTANLTTCQKKGL